MQEDQDTTKHSNAEKELTPVDLALREVKAAYVAAKRRYRVTPARIEKLQQALDLYLGTRNYHNYTIMKSHKDPSAKRHIKSFQVNATPITIRDTQWLSLKVHGQSFMMHQIRKMVAMAVMVVRCGAPLATITESYGPRRISIPKAPGLGLMLERPMFTEYNKKAAGLGKDAIDFAQWEAKIEEFKDQHIYRRMFELEEKENS
jgi:tRNA pseudouridine38-40 synthase